MRLLLATILSLWFLSGNAQYQKYLSQGDKSYNKLELNGALLKYFNAYEDSASQEVVRKIAATYYVLREWEKAETWFFKLLSYPEQSPKDYLEYITCLAYLDKKEECLTFLTYLREYFPKYQPPPGFEFWINQRFFNPCKPDRTKTTKISYCIDIDISSSIDETNKDVRFLWKMDDGFKKEGTKIKHCFLKAGNHKITLTSVDSSLGHARISDTTFTVSFVEEPDFKVGGGTTVGENVSFYGYNLKEHPDYFGMVWEISDGSLHFKEAFNHKFYLPGSYYIVLHVFGKNENDEIYQVACLTRNWYIKRGG